MLSLLYRISWSSTFRLFPHVRQSPFGVSCWGQGRQEEAPTLEKVPSWQVVHVSLAPIEKVFLGQIVREVRSEEGL